MAWRVTNILITGFINIPKHEAYLEYMAKKGLFLQHYALAAIHFTRDEPGDVQYRIDVSLNEPDGEQREIYKNAGWEFVTKVCDYYIYRSKKGESPVEIHTDNVEKAYSLKKINKRIVILSLINLACIVFTVARLISNILTNTPVLQVIDHKFIDKLVVFLIGGFILWCIVADLGEMYSYKRFLLGKKKKKVWNFKREGIYNGIGKCIFFSLFASTSILQIATAFMTQDYPLQQSLPIVYIEDVSHGKNVTRQEYIYNDKDIYNKMTKSKHLFLNDKIDTYEIAEVESLGSVSMKNVYYDFIFPKMAVEGARELAMVKEEKNSGWIGQEVKVLGLDYAFVITTDYDTQVLVCKGDKVLYTQCATKSIDTKKLLESAKAALFDNRVG